MRVFTRGGCPPLGELAGQVAEVWSGRRWITVRVDEAPGLTEFLRVCLDDGTCLICAEDHPWAVVEDGGLVPVRAGDLRADHTVSPFFLCPPGDLVGVAVGDAYDQGATFAGRLSRRRLFKVELPAHVFTMDCESLGLFVAGWMDAQKGTLCGPLEVIHHLQIAVVRLGVYHTFVENMGTYSVLTLSETDGDLVPNPKGLRRQHRRTTTDLPRVTSVCRIGGRKKAFTITSDDPRARTVVLDGVLTLC